MIRCGLQKTLTQLRACNHPQATGFVCFFVIFLLIYGLVFAAPASANSGSTTDDNNVSLIGETINEVDSLVGGLLDSTSGAVNELVADLVLNPEPVTTEKAVSNASTPNTSGAGTVNELVDGLDTTVESITDDQIAPALNSITENSSNPGASELNKPAANVDSLVSGLVDGIVGVANGLTGELGSVLNSVTGLGPRHIQPESNNALNHVNQVQVSSGVNSVNEDVQNTVVSNLEAEDPQLELGSPTNAVGDSVSIAGQNATNDPETGNAESSENRLVSFFTAGILTADSGGGNGGSSRGSSNGSYHSGNYQAGITADPINQDQLPLTGFIDDTTDPDRLPPFIVLFSPPG